MANRDAAKAAHAKTAKSLAIGFLLFVLVVVFTEAITRRKAPDTRQASSYGARTSAPAEAPARQTTAHRRAARPVREPRPAIPSPASEPAPWPAASVEPEYALAAIEAGWRVEADDYRVRIFAVLLDRLEAKTVNSRGDIGDIIVKTSELAARDGRPISVLGVAQALDASIPPEAVGAGLDLELREVAAMWLALHVKGW